MRKLDGWHKAPEYLTDFNGLKYERRNIRDNGDLGIFNERYTCNGCKYTLRSRPDGSSWGDGIPLTTIKECKEYAEKHFLDIVEESV